MKIKRKNTPATKKNRQLPIKTGYELFFKFESVWSMLQSILISYCDHFIRGPIYDFLPSKVISDCISGASLFIFVKRLKLLRLTMPSLIGCFYYNFSYEKVKRLHSCMVSLIVCWYVLEKSNLHCVNYVFADKLN